MSDPTAHGMPASDLTSNLAPPAVALAIGAHPDDIEFGCGGTLAKWAAGGCAIHHLVLTDGSKGTWDPAADIARLIEERRVEQQEASRRLGGEGRVTFLGYTDGELEAGLAQRSLVARCIREVRPDVVLGHDPWRRYRLHPDHRNAGFLATDGIVAARDPFFFPEHGLEPHRPNALLLWEADTPDHLEDIQGFTDLKLEALLAHRSQFRSTMRIGDSGAVADQTRAFAERMAERQRQAGLPLGLAAAEAFKLMKDL
jgi:LmbE family N-acetylglucosaminyl deacetylase